MKTQRLPHNAQLFVMLNLTGTLMLCTVMSTAQSLTLVSERGKRVIQEGTWIEISTAESYSKEDEGKCVCPVWGGKFVKHENDSLYFHMQWKTESYGDHGVKEALSHQFVNDASQYPVVALATKDVTYLAPKGRRKKANDQSLVGRIGMVAFLAGFGGVINSALADNSDELLVISSAEFFGGMIMGFAGERPTYYTGQRLAADRKKPLWSIQ